MLNIFKFSRSRSLVSVVVREVPGAVCALRMRMANGTGLPGDGLGKGDNEGA